MRKTRSRRGHQTAHLRDKWQSYLLKSVDLGLAAVVLVAPIFMGGRHAVGELVYVALVCTTALAWTARNLVARDSGWNRSGVEILLLGVLLLFIVQLTPLPSAVLHQLSPKLADALPLWAAGENSGANLGTWTQISLFPSATRGLLVMFLAHAMLFLVVVQRIRERTDAERLLRLLAVGVVAMAVLGIAQFLLSNGKFLWIYQHTSRDTSRVVKGPFINENHFAHFLALGIGPLLWWIQSAWRTPAGNGKRKRQTHRGPTFQTRSREHKTPLDGRQMLMLGALGTVLLAGLLTFSRGGVVVLLLALMICSGIYIWKSLLGKKAIAALSAVGLLVVVALLIYGYTPLADQLATLGAGSIDDIDHHAARRKLWQADLEGFSNFRMLGTGGGSHAQVYPMYYENYADREFVYAESGYIQILLEFGTAGIVSLAVALGFFGWWCVRSLWKAGSAGAAACGGAVAASFAASVVHSVWDFVWYIPSCMSVTIIVAALACRLNQLATSEQKTGQPAQPVGRIADPSYKSSNPKLHTTVWIAATFVTLVLSVVMIRSRIGPAIASVHWERYLTLAVAGREDGYIVSDEETNTVMVDHLQKAVGADPHHARARLMLAALRLQRFDIRQQSSVNPMPLSQVRDAALSSGFTSNAALHEWLAIAVGDNLRLLDQAEHDAKRALAACPLQGDGYVYLADLAFLYGKRQADQLVKQALRVRPYSGPVLVKAGIDAAVAGDLQSALDFWKRAYHQDPQQRSRIVETLAPNVPASFFLAEFQPDLDGAKEIYRAFRGLGRDDQARQIGTMYARMLIEDAEKGGDNTPQNWRTAADVYSFLGDADRALACRRSAVDAAPNDFAMHKSLAVELFRQERFDEAMEEIEWCLFRKPTDAGLRNLRTRAMRGRAEKSLETRLGTSPETPNGLR